MPCAPEMLNTCVSVALIHTRATLDENTVN